VSVSRYLFYIHGFNSSPKSAKACLIADYLQNCVFSVDYRVPELSYCPESAISTLDAAVNECISASEQKGEKPVIGLIGSSMGGFYGTWIAEKYRLPLVLVNPAVRPYRLLKNYLGINKNVYTGEEYNFTEANIQQLQRMDVDPVTLPERYLLLSQKGDEVLDYKEGVEKYSKSRQIIQPGGSHGFDEFETQLPGILAFLF